MENYFEINISQNGGHLFATAPRSIRTQEELDRVLPTLKEKFPRVEGYELSVTHWQASGRHIEV